MTDIIYDITIIGAGPAGMTAAIYASRAGKTVAIIDRNGFGGNIAKSPRIENIPGFLNISGADFAEKMYEQISVNLVHTYINEAKLINYRYGLFKVSLDSNEVICSKSIIYACGTEHRQLELDTKDIYYCVTCDGPFFKDKPVTVVGSGNSGATYALELSKYCKKVYICDLTPTMRCEKTLIERIAKTENIEWLSGDTINQVENKNGKLSNVYFVKKGKVKCNAIFAAIGLIPQTLLLDKFAEINEQGYIVSDDCTTSLVPGIFVAGDCRTSKVKQVVTATADGATAALEAIKFLDSVKR